MERGDIWLVTLDPSAGHEQGGKRPVLIVSPALFNAFIRSPIVVLIASGRNFFRAAGFTVSLDGAGCRTTDVIRCDQPGTIDMEASEGRRLERIIPEAIVNDVLARLEAIMN